MGDSVRVYTTGAGRVLIADDGGWFPGYYDTEETARAALAAGETEAFIVMQQQVNHVGREDRAITLADLASVVESHG